MSRPGRRRTAPARRLTLASAPRAAQDQPPAEACPFPMRRTPRLLGALQGPRAPRRTGPELVADRRSVGGIPPYARRPRSPCYDWISAVTATSLGGLAYKNRAPCPSSRWHRRPPRHPRRRRSAASSGHPRRKPAPPTHPLGPLEACAVACLLGTAPPHRSRSTPRRSLPAIAVRHHLVPFRPNSECSRALCELTLLPAPLHVRERRRPRRNWPSRAAPMAKVHIASPYLFLGCLLQTGGMVVTL
jgi:hypothetical protein